MKSDIKIILMLFFFNIAWACPHGCVDPQNPIFGSKNIIRNYLNLDQKMADRYKSIDDKIKTSIEKDKKILENTNRRLKLYSLRNLWLHQTERNIKNTNSVLTY